MQYITNWVENSFSQDTIWKKKDLLKEKNQTEVLPGKALHRNVKKMREITYWSNKNMYQMEMTEF